MKKLKFKLKKGRGGVSGFTDAQGNTHRPGDIVDLPASYKGEKWLEPVEKEKKPEVPPAIVEPAAPASEEKPSPLPEKKSRSKKEK